MIPDQYKSKSYLALLQTRLSSSTKGAINNYVTRCPSVGHPPPLTCPPGQYSLGNFVPPDIIHWRILSP